MSNLRGGIFPDLPHPKTLDVLDVRPWGWHEHFTLTSLQGLVNRKQPRVYHVYDDFVDRKWLEIYRERYGIGWTEVDRMEELLSKYAREARGYVVYDDTMLHSANVAMTWGSVHDAIAVSPALEPTLRGLGLARLEDFRGRWKGKLDAYGWALDNLMDKCSPAIAGCCCVEGFYVWPNTRLHHIRDYLVAAKGFIFDLSVKVRDRDECRMFDRILERIPGLGLLLGWHCSKCFESEYVARAAKHGLFVLCNLRSPNLSVHGGIHTDYTFRQRHTRPEEVKLEDKVYVTFIHSDGDAMWAHNDFYNRNWLDSQRGKFPLTWEIQPTAIDMAPGLMEHYYRTATPNDYFVAGPSGAGYTSPMRQKRRKEYFAHTRAYMERTDLKTAFVMSRDPRANFEELDETDVAEMYVREVGGELGYIHGYLGSPWGWSKFVGDVPFSHTTLYVNHVSDIPHEVTLYARRCATRPLFVSVHVRESSSFGTLRGTVLSMDPKVYKMVNTDHFLLAMREAIRRGKVTETYPELEKLTETLVVRGWAGWQENYARLLKLESLVELDEVSLLREMTSSRLEFRTTDTADYLAYETLEILMYLVRAALAIREIFVNNLERGAKDMVRVFREVPDVVVFQELYELRRDWDSRSLEMPTVRALARRAVAVAHEINRILLATPDKG